MANEQNLDPVRTKEEARERGRRGGIASGKARRERKTLREELLALLSVKAKGEDGKMHTMQESISAALIERALAGDVKAFQAVRDTIGEMPEQTLNITQVDYSALDAVHYGDDDN